MGINVSSLSPTQAREYWYDYNNGNKKGLSDAEYATLCTKFKDYIKTWEQDENDYGYKPSPEDSLEFDADDAGLLGTDGNAIQTTTNLGVTVGAGVANLVVSKGTELLVVGGGGSGYSGAFSGLQGLLLVAAAAQYAMAKWVQANSPNEEAAEACKQAQELLLEEQAKLAEQILNMEEMQEYMAVLQAEAEAANEQGQDKIATMEGVYKHYLDKYNQGTATENEIKLLNALSMQMKITQTATATETGELNTKIADIGAQYEDITANIEYTNEFTNYVADFDQATKISSFTQGIMMGLSTVSAGITAFQCFARAGVLSGSFVLSWLAAAYIAAGAFATKAATIFGEETIKQFQNHDIAKETIEIRGNTDKVSEDTTKFQETSMEYWDETVTATDEENLFTLTPTYAGNTVSTKGASDGTNGNSRGTTGSTEFGGLTAGATGGTGGTGNGEDDDKDKDGKK